MIYNLAIELGSKFTSIYKAGVGVILKESSLIAMKQVGKEKQVVACGDDAKKMVNKTNTITEVVAPIKNGAIESFLYAKEMLKFFLNKINEKGKLFKNNKVVFVVPCGLTLEEKKNFKNLAYSLNINVVAFVPQAVSALIGMGVDVNSPKTHMVLNIGGNITDVAVVSGCNIVNGAQVNIGGATIDKAIMDYLRARHGLVVSENTAEELKENIISLHPRDKSSAIISGIDASSGIHKSVNINATEIFNIVNEFFCNVSKICETLLNACASDVIADITKVGIYVCGGLANTYYLDNFLQGKLKLSVFVHPEPSSAVILGCGFLLNNPQYLTKINADN